MASNFILYHYIPSLVGAIIFILLFLLAIIFHSIQLSRFRAWYLIPVIVGGIFESIAYICRAIGHSLPQSQIPYIIGSVLALVAPALFAATIYMILGRIMRLLHAEQHSLIPVDKLTKNFVCFDILSFQVQSAGAGMQAGKKSTLQHTGQILVVVALFLQIIIFCVFLVVAIVFHKRTLRQPTRVSIGSLPWKLHLGGLYGASGLILVRSIVRTVEYIQGYGGYINGHELYLYIFDAVPIFCVMVVMVAIYAPSLLQRRKGEELGETVGFQNNERKEGETA